MLEKTEKYLLQELNNTESCCENNVKLKKKLAESLVAVYDILLS